MKTLLLCSIAAFALTAYGTPSRSGEPFSFDPEPVTVRPDGTAVALGTEGEPHVADQVTVLAEIEAMPRLEKWFERNGFEVLQRSDERRSGWTVVVLRVPVGAVAAAAELIRRQDGVIAAYPVTWQRLGRSFEHPAP